MYYGIKTCGGGRYVFRHSELRQETEMSGQLQAGSALPPWKNPRCLVGSIAGFEAMVIRNICPCRESTCGFPVCRLFATTTELRHCHTPAVTSIIRIFRLTVLYEMTYRLTSYRTRLFNLRPRRLNQFYLYTISKVMLSLVFPPTFLSPFLGYLLSFIHCVLGR